MAKSKKLSPFARFSKQQIIIALVFILGFGGFGVYKLAFSSAHTQPPSNISHGKTLNAVAADGVWSLTWCHTVVGLTEYGPVASCFQFKPGTYERIRDKNTLYRTGFYSPITKIFTPGSGWSYQTITIWNPVCNNMRNQFSGSSPINTANGPTMYGQIYRQSGGKWQIKWANKNLVNGRCSTSGGWMDAQPW